MQSSFWKTVSVVGVIGIGSLVILEVQHRLHRPGAPAEVTVDDLPGLDDPSAEQAMEAMLTTSQFDQMLAQNSPPEKSFNGYEPPAEPTATDDGTMLINSQPVPPQDVTPPVNTAVRSSQLAQGGNPFEDQTGGAVAATYKADSTPVVETVGFVPNEKTTKSLSVSGQPTPVAAFEPDSSSPTALKPTPQPEPQSSGNNDSPFSLFGETKSEKPGASSTQLGKVSTVSTSSPFTAEPASSTAQTAANAPAATSAEKSSSIPASQGPAIPASSTFSDGANSSSSPFNEGPLNLTASAPPESGRPGGSPGKASFGAPPVTAARNNNNAQPMLFFGDQQNSTAAEPVSTARSQPPSGADSPFYSSESQPSGQQPLRQAPVNSSPFTGDPEPPSRNSEPFPGLPNGPVPGSSSPVPGSSSPLPQPGGRDFFSEDLVPDPRAPATNPGQSPGRGFPTTEPELPPRTFPMPATDRLPIPGGSMPRDSVPDGTLPSGAGSPVNDSSLPFAEDVDSIGGSAPFRVPELPDDRMPSNSGSPLPDRMPLPDRTPLPDRMPFSQPRTNPGVPFDGLGGTFDQTPRRLPDSSSPFDSSNVPPRTNPGPRSTPDPRTSPDPRTFDTSPRTNPGRTVPVPIPSNGTREFGSGSSGLQFNAPGNGRNRQVSGAMSPNLVLEKSAPENATVGTPLDYKITVSNEGDATAYEVVVEDDVKNGARIDGARPQPQLDRANSKLIWTFDEVKPGETKEIVVRVTPTGEGTMDGVATVKFKSRVKATTVITAPKLRFQMTGPREVKLGEEVSYRYVISNDGTGEARDVYVRTVLPADGGLKHPQGRDLEYEIESMQPGEQREVVLTVAAAEAGDFRTEAEVTAAGGSADRQAWRTTVIGAQLQIVRRGPKRRFVGRPGTYENVISNETNFPALNAKVVEEVPEGLRFVSANRGGRYDEQTRTVTWMIDRLDAGRQELLEIELMPTAPGSRESVVRILENAGFTSDDYVSTTVVEDLHNISADISQLNGPVALNETFGFTIAVDNRGTADATDIDLSVEVPDAIQVIGAGSQDVQAKLLDGNVVQYNMVVRIQPGQKQNFELKLKGVRPVRNGAVKARVRYKQMEEPLVVSESVTVYNEEL